MEREQRIHKTASRTVVSTNWTLGGDKILLVEGGGGIIRHSGGAGFYGCGCERIAGIDSCSCGF